MHQPIDPKKSPLTPMAHQVEALRRIRDRPKSPSDQDVFAILADMGAGKSKMICDEWTERVYAKDIRDLLIFAPAGSYENWWRDREDSPSELTKQLPPELREHAVIAGWKSGSSKAKISIERLLSETKRPRVLVVNVEAISSVHAARVACQEFLEKSSRGAMTVVDESTRIKNHGAERTESIIRLGAMSRARRIMTGLVTPRSPLDLFSQFNFLDWRILGFREYYPFRARYAVMEQRMIWIPGRGEREGRHRRVRLVVGYRREEELRERIAPYSYRVLKRDCLDLDEKIYMPPRFVSMTLEQARIYADIREFATSALSESDHVTATAVIAQIQKLHQVSCGFVRDEEGKTHEVPSRKMDELVDILGEHDGKVVIWTCFQEHVRMIVRRLEKEFGEGCAVMFYGGNRSTRGDDEAKWKRNGGPSYMVATTGAGGLGNNWSVADLNVYMANDFDLEHRAQSEDRTHRKGQTRGVTYIDIVTRDSVDERILQALRDKINMATTITGEDWREWIV